MLRQLHIIKSKAVEVAAYVIDPRSTLSAFFPPLLFTEMT